MLIKKLFSLHLLEVLPLEIFIFEIFSMAVPTVLSCLTNLYAVSGLLMNVSGSLEVSSEILSKPSTALSVINGKVIC